MSEHLSVSVCVNDPRHGMPTGYLCKLDVDELEIEAPSYPDGGIVFRRVGDNRVKIGRHTYPIVGYAMHVGNWCWDELAMERADVRRLIARLLASGFDVIAGPIECDLLPTAPAAGREGEGGER